jgi:hypothetical protein
VAGNGGTMAEEEAKLKKTKSRSTANPTRARRAGGKPYAKAKKTLPEKSELEKVYEALDVSGPDDEDVDGIEKLRVSVNRVIAKRSVELAKRLAQQAEEGNLSSAKLIVVLGSKKKKRAKKLSATALLLDATSMLEREQELVVGGSKSDPN